MDISLTWNVNVSRRDGMKLEIIWCVMLTWYDGVAC